MQNLACRPNFPKLRDLNYNYAANPNGPYGRQNRPSFRGRARPYSNNVGGPGNYGPNAIQQNPGAYEGLLPTGPGVGQYRQNGPYGQGNLNGINGPGGQYNPGQQNNSPYNQYSNVPSGPGQVAGGLSSPGGGSYNDGLDQYNNLGFGPNNVGPSGPRLRQKDRKRPFGLYKPPGFEISGPPSRPPPGPGPGPPSGPRGRQPNKNGPQGPQDFLNEPYSGPPFQQLQPPQPTQDFRQPPPHPGSGPRPGGLDGIFEDFGQGPNGPELLGPPGPPQVNTGPESQQNAIDQFGDLTDYLPGPGKNENPIFIVTYITDEGFTLDYEEFKNRGPPPVTLHFDDGDQSGYDGAGEGPYPFGAGPGPTAPGSTGPSGPGDIDGDYPKDRTPPSGPPDDEGDGPYGPQSGPSGGPNGRPNINGPLSGPGSGPSGPRIPPSGYPGDGPPGPGPGPGPEQFR